LLALSCWDSIRYENSLRLHLLSLSICWSHITPCRIANHHLKVELGTVCVCSLNTLGKGGGDKEKLDWGSPGTVFVGQIKPRIAVASTQRHDRATQWISAAPVFNSTHPIIER